MTKETSWERVGKWYDQIVSTDGHYFHKQVIFPKLKSFFPFKEGDALLDLGCGQGVFASYLPKKVEYYGLDLAVPLIKKAKQYHPKKHFFVRDITQPLKIDKKDFSHALFLLSLQNIAHPRKAIKQAHAHLKKGGRLVLVLNHVCFRIPKQTHWHMDHEKKIQSRLINRYLSPLKIPIDMHPGSPQKKVATYSYHHSLSDLFTFLKEAGFVVTHLEEWCSNKKSTGKWAKMENIARKEFPLFLAIEALKT